MRREGKGLLAVTLARLYLKRLRNLAWLFYFHPLLAAQLTPEDADLASGDAKLPGQKLDQVPIGAALDRRRRNANLNTVTVQADDFILSGLGL